MCLHVNYKKIGNFSVAFDEVQGRENQCFEIKMFTVY